MKWGDILRKEGYLKNERYIMAFNSINREDFLPSQMKKYSTDDEPLPLFMNQTQSAPHMNAILLEEAKINKDDSVLEIGTGSGYFTAILAIVSKFVVTIEFFQELANFAKWNLGKYGFHNVITLRGNFFQTCFKIKFDKIIFTASLKSIPDSLRNLLGENGVAVLPIGDTIPQKLIKIDKNGEYNLGEVYFVNIIY